MVRYLAQQSVVECMKVLSSDAWLSYGQSIFEGMKVLSSAQRSAQPQPVCRRGHGGVLPKSQTSARRLQRQPCAVPAPPPAAASDTTSAPPDLGSHPTCTQSICC